MSSKRKPPLPKIATLDLRKTPFEKAVSSLWIWNQHPNSSYSQPVSGLSVTGSGVKEHCQMVKVISAPSDWCSPFSSLIATDNYVQASRETVFSRRVVRLLYDALPGDEVWSAPGDVVRAVQYFNDTHPREVVEAWFERAIALA